MRIPIAAALLGGLLAGSATAQYEGPKTGSSPTTAPLKTTKVRQILQRQLGQFLFRSTLLSADGKQTCATCHQPDRGFTDGLVEPPGIVGTGGGRNTPTLVGLRHVAHYPGTMETRRRSRRPIALDLAERCVAPIENPLEMGADMNKVLKRLRASKAISAKFEAAFGPSTQPVSEKALGQALGAFVETLLPKQTRYHDYLAGNKKALTKYEHEGLGLFRDYGCASCHEGEALSDGLMHVAFPPNSRRAEREQRRTREITDELARVRLEDAWEQSSGEQRQSIERRLRNLEGNRQPRNSMPNCSPGQRLTSFGYDGGQTPGQRIELQTLTLWDVDRTGPWLRDGSESTLRGAVVRHLANLKGIHDQRKQVRGVLTAQRRTKTRMPNELRARTLYRPDPAVRKGVSHEDVDRIVAFLKTLSPDSRRINNSNELNG